MKERSSWIFVFITYPGYDNWIKGTAKLRKVFLIYPNGMLAKYLISSRVCNPAIDVVVVDKAGTIRPALILVVTQSIGSSL